MPTNYPCDRIRIAAEVTAKGGGLTDVITGSSPQIFRGKDVQFEFGFFFDGGVIDLSHFTSVTIAIKDKRDLLGLVLASKTVASFTLTLTAAQWEEGSAQHLTLQFTGAEMKLDLEGADSRTFWLVISGLTNDTTPKRVAFGAGPIEMLEDGTSEDDTSVPPLGSSIIPLGAVYDGSGHYTLAVTAGKLHSYTKGANDTSITNGTETVAASGTFAAQGASITLNGTAGALITATIRYPLVLTADQSDARYLNGMAKLMNDKGVAIGLRSPSGQYVRMLGVDDNGNLTDQVIDTTA